MNALPFIPTCEQITIVAGTLAIISGIVGWIAWRKIQGKRRVRPDKKIWREDIIEKV